MNKRKFFLMLIVLLSMCSCVSAVMESGHIAKDNIKRSNNEDAAKKGDKVAQFNMGEAYCCSTEKTGPAYDTIVAVQWLCASAKQGYGPAMYKLGKIYSGDVIDGLRLLRRVTTGLTETMTGSTVSLPVAYAWLKLASTYGVEDAKERLLKVKGEMSPLEIRKGENYLTSGGAIPCKMKEVFG